MAVTCTTLEEVRSNIDRLDQQIVSLLAERGHYVSQAARFKKDTDGVKAPQRVEQVISKVRDLSQTVGANPEVTEQVYRAMIAAFISRNWRNTGLWRTARPHSLVVREPSFLITGSALTDHLIVLHTFLTPLSHLPDKSLSQTSPISR